MKMGTFYAIARCARIDHYVRGMPGGFFALLDDIALLMDDVAVVTKLAGKKTAGILGDDLAVNAEKAVGFKASRELPVLWSITKGSFLNKVIILPLAFLLESLAPWAIEPVLILGGVYLAFEGVEKVVHIWRPHPKGHKPTERPDERTRIRSAVLVDFILSVEIVIIALGSVVEAAPLVQMVTVSIIALLATVGVYGLVALIVRMDDLGMTLTRREGAFAKRLGSALIAGLPWVIRLLSVVGTVALFLVSGGIFHHHIPALHHAFESWPGLAVDVMLSSIVGGFTLLLVLLAKRVKGNLG